MAFLIPPRFLFLFAVLAFPSSSLFSNADPCSDEFRNAIALEFKITRNCRKKTLGAQLAWNYNTKSRLLEIAFGYRLDFDSVGWLAWGLNPDGPHMVGTRALIGIKHRNGSREIHAYDVTRYTKNDCDLLPDGGGVARDLGVRTFNFTYVQKIDYYVILAMIDLPEAYNAFSAHVVWQIGDGAGTAQPLMHPISLKHLSTAETIDLVASKVISNSPHLRRSLVKVHGILSIVGWGTLLPCGVIISRYFKEYPIVGFRPWQEFHKGFQMAGYTIGSTGWAIGLWLGNTSKYYFFNIHRTLGIIIFTFTTIQMLAWILKPGDDAEFRSYWNMYHHFLGYSLLVLISVNIFYGIAIVAPDDAWKWSYIAVLGALGAVVVLLEGYTWIKFLWGKK